MALDDVICNGDTFCTIWVFFPELIDAARWNMSAVCFGRRCFEEKDGEGRPYFEFSEVGG